MSYSQLVNLLDFDDTRKLPMMYQSEAAECGLACLAMIANFHGHELNLVSLRHKHSISLKGASLEEITKVSDTLDLTPRALRLELDEMIQLQTPCILHWELNHFVVLKKVTKNYIVVNDPAIGVRKYNFKDVSEKFTGVALELSPNQTFKKIEDKSDLKLSSFWSGLSNTKGFLIQIFSLSLAIQIFAIASPFYMQTAIDKVVVSNDMELLIILAIGFTGLMIFSLVTSTLRSFIVLRMGTQMSLQIGSNLFNHLIRLPIEFFEKRHIGDIISRYSSSGNIYRFLTNGLIEVLLDGIMMFGMLGLILIYSPLLASIVFISLSLYAVIRIISYNVLKQKIEESIVKKANESSVFMESIRGVLAIKLFGKESQRQTYWQNKFVESLNTGVAVSRLNIWFSVINKLIFGMENIIIVYFSVVLVLESELTIGMMFAFMSYKASFSSRVSSLIEKVIQYKLLKLHLDRLSDIVLTKPELFPSSSTHSNSQKLKGKIEIVDLGYRYSEGGPFVFRHVNLTIEQKDSIAITGASGTGKTTLLKIILGLIKPTEGDVLIDGRSIASWNKQELRSQMGSVMQEDCLFAGSITENISFFDPITNFRQVQIAAFKARILKDITEMPMGFESLVGELGSSLSGGQKQRIYLARALYKKPKILIMDEATSHLDVTNEKLINKQLSKWNTTRILVAHRQETINSVEKVYCLDNNQLELQSVLIKEHIN
jgi:ATP-binding cassette subfamily B protein RaxB